MIEKPKKAKPFLKWAGGKTQLINQIKKQTPNEILAENFIYIEPFVGSGAVLFSMINQFSNIKKIIVNDNNTDLINTYLTIKKEVKSLINILVTWGNEYHDLNTNIELKKDYYYKSSES